MKKTLSTRFAEDRAARKILVNRQFSAPVAAVWQAWTISQLLDRWWAPKPWQARTKKMKFKEGGHWLYAMVGPEGETHWSRADYSAIVPEKSFSGLDAFTDENGKINDKLPKSSWTVKFSGDANTTTVDVEIAYDELTDLEATLKMGFREGFDAALGNLDQLLAQVEK